MGRFRTETPYSECQAKSELVDFDAPTCRSSIYQIKNRSASNPFYK
ncbi:MAG: hypothetical protein JWQ10_1282 [Herbaspirillum sp.]|nr:hypothetical protein [Herbaspirillum sp.]